VDNDVVAGMALIVAGVSAVLIAAGCGGDDSSEEDRDRAIAAAQQAYDIAVTRGDDLDVGPCIAEDLPDLADWVVDIAHDPREDVDDNPANQCQRYRDGDAAHFVELTPEGELIRAE
jgi:hypothetical protein